MKIICDWFLKTPTDVTTAWEKNEVSQEVPSTIQKLASKKVLYTTMLQRILYNYIGMCPAFFVKVNIAWSYAINFIRELNAIVNVFRSHHAIIMN